MAYLQREYDIPNYVKRSVTLKMPEYYRRFKSDLRMDYLDKYPTIEEQEKHVPNGVREEDWKEFVRNESTPEAKAIRAQNAKNKKASKYVWGGGQKSAAEVEYEMVIEFLATSTKIVI